MARTLLTKGEKLVTTGSGTNLRLVLSPRGESSTWSSFCKCCLPKCDSASLCATKSWSIKVKGPATYHPCEASASHNYDVSAGFDIKLSAGQNSGMKVPCMLGNSVVKEVAGEVVIGSDSAAWSASSSGKNHWSYGTSVTFRLCGGSDDSNRSILCPTCGSGRGVWGKYVCPSSGDPYVYVWGNMRAKGEAWVGGAAHRDECSMTVKPSITFGGAELVVGDNTIVKVRGTPYSKGTHSISTAPVYFEVL